MENFEAENIIIHFNNRKILERVLHGEANINNIVESWKKVTTLVNSNDNIKGILSNLIDVDLNFKKPEEINKLAQLFVEHFEELKTVKIAFLIDTPLKTIFPIIAQQRCSKLLIRPFSTHEAAMHWLSY